MTSTTASRRTRRCTSRCERAGCAGSGPGRSPRACPQGRSIAVALLGEGRGTRTNRAGEDAGERTPVAIKPPEERHAEIVKTAARVALEEGLEKVTARRVAQALDVVPGLITHCFRSADDLVSIAFTHVAAKERNVVFSHAEAAATAVEQIRRLLDDWFDMDTDPVSLLWLGASQASRRRATLLRTVTEQMRADLERLEVLIRGGIDR